MIDRTLTSRYECKYLLRPGRADGIRRAIAPFVRPDRHARARPGFRYPICSLYLDTPALDLYRQGLAGLKNRLKLRVRTYSDGETPVFFEVKKRMNGIVAKARTALPRHLALPVLDHLVGRETDQGELALDGAGEFGLQARRLGAVPVVRVRYEREAYESVGTAPVRITFDTALRHAMTSDPELSHVQGEWLDTPIEGVILEIKFTDVFPSWVVELVHEFQLDRRSISKYNHAVAGLGEPALGLQRLLRRSG